MYQFTFLRHAESAGNANGQIQGQIDMPLTTTGIDQAAELAWRWKSEGRQYDQIIASPLQRAWRTAQIISEGLDLPLVSHPDLVERGFGSIEGRLLAELMQEEPPPNFTDPYRKPGGEGESLVEVYNRAGQVLQGLLLRPPGRYLVVSHGAFLNMLLYAVVGLSPHNNPRSLRFSFSNTGYLDLVYLPDIQQWRIVQFTNLAE